MKTKNLNKYKKYILIVFVLVFFLTKSTSFAQNISSQCLKDGYTVLTINGVWTDDSGAKKNKAELARYLGPEFNGEKITLDYLLNPPHGGGTLDIKDAIAQGDFDQKSDYDLTNILVDGNQKITTQKVLIVGHSQGNFYANNFYDKVTKQEFGIPAQSIGVYSVATPADHVAGGGSYMNSSTDNVIYGLPGSVFQNKLLATTTISEAKSSINPFAGHDFKDVYLTYRPIEIVKGIQASLKNLQTNDIQNPKVPCMSAPILDQAFINTGAMLSLLDHPIVSLKIGAVAVADSVVFGISKTALAIGTGIKNVASAIGSAVGSFTQTISTTHYNNVAVSNSAAVILADGQENQQEIQPAIQSETESKPAANVKSETSPVVVAKVVAAPVESVVAIAQATSTIQNALVSFSTVSQSSPPHIFHSPRRVVVEDPTPDPEPSDDEDDDDDEASPDPTPATPDTTAPVISVLGVDPVTIETGDVYTDAGATTTDDVDGAITPVVTGAVDNSVVGVYTITYTATDAANNVATATRTVNVVAPTPAPDVTSPVLTLLGNSLETIAINSTYTDAGATATDAVDGAITPVVSGTVDTSLAGVYTLTYTATDAALNTASTTRRVRVDSGAMLNSPYGVVVSGNYAYVVSSDSNALEIVDVSNPAAPIHISYLLHDPFNPTLFAPKSVAVSGNYAYVVSYSNVLEIINISDPLAPVHKGTLNNGDGGAALRCPVSIVVSGSYAYIASSGCGNGNPGNIEIVDISDPANPVHTSSLGVGGLNTTLSIVVSGNYMYVTYINIGTSGGGLKIFDISNPALPVFQNLIEDGTDGAGIDLPNSVFVSGNYAYIVNVQGHNLEIVDISNPQLPIHKGTLVNGTGGASIFSPRSVFVSGNYAYIASFVGTTLEIVDVSDPTNPVHKGSLADGVGGANLNYPISIFVSGNYAYVASTFGDALEIVDISDPANPVHAGKILNGTFH